MYDCGLGYLILTYNLLIIFEPDNLFYFLRNKFTIEDLVDATLTRKTVCHDSWQ